MKTEEVQHLRRQLASPPAGWFAFGHHADQRIELEFWGADIEGTPLWERPANA